MARRVLNPRHLVSQALRLEDQLEQLKNSRKPVSDVVLKELCDKANRAWKAVHRYPTHVDLGLIEQRMQKIKVFRKFKNSKSSRN